MEINLYNIPEMCADERQVYRVCGGEMDSKAVVMVETSEWDALIASQQASSPDSLKPGILEGIAYNMEYIDAETVVFNRCR